MGVLKGCDLNADMLEAVGGFSRVIENMDVVSQNMLIQGLISLNKIGVKYFGMRDVYLNGNTSIFTTCLPWLVMTKDKDFQLKFKKHMNVEIVNVLKDRYSIVTRSSDKLFSVFLQELEGRGLNNSIIQYKNYKNMIRIFYYIGSSGNPNIRDKIINNMSNIEKIVSNMSNPLSIISNSKEFDINKVSLLTNGVIREIEDITRYNNRVVNICGKKVALTTLDLEYLKLLEGYRSNSIIAEKMNKSIYSVRDKVQVLKEKFGVETKKELMEIVEYINF
ncbi:MAG: hypothetical protein HRU35_08010 [Rickettsiaceae bacterium]|nr:hypothetical protein [Rickettsiaceae bacterium]